jgi:hypothetical protein
VTITNRTDYVLQTGHIICSQQKYFLLTEIFSAISEVLKLLWFVSEELFCLDWSSLEMGGEAERDAKGT